MTPAPEIRGEIEEETGRMDTAKQRLGLILRIVAGELTVEEAAQRYGHSADEIRHWEQSFLQGAERALFETHDRRSPDLLTRSISWLSAIAWLFAVATLLLIDRARPNPYHLPFQIVHGQAADAWNQRLLILCFGMLIATALLCGAGLMINSRRHRRKEDRYSRSLIVFGVLSAIGAAALIH